jgi:glutamate-1-semialdehyde 2,1-aminomutase
LATLRILAETPGLYETLEKASSRLVDGVAAAAKETGVPMTINRVGSMFTFFFTAGAVTDWDSASQSDAKRFGAFFRGMLEAGVYLPCSQYEAAFL